VDTDETPTTPETDQDVTGPKGHAWGYQHGYGVMFRKLAAAITSALETAQMDPAADPNQLLQDTMAQFIADHNIEAPGRRVQRNISAAAHQVASASPPAYENFVQMLRSYGIDAHQLRKDFFEAFKQARKGTVDPGIALQSFPPGATLDAAT
jgi:hypothetical protein